MEKIKKFFADRISVGSSIEADPFMALRVSVMSGIVSDKAMDA